MIKGLTDPIRVGEGKEDIVTAIVVDSGGRSPESRVLPMTRGLTARHEQQQANRGGECGDRQSRRECGGGHAKQTK